MDAQEAHDHSSHHKEEIESSKKCGCFYCLKTFSPNEIEDWVDGGETALCPYCRIDSVIGDVWFPITKGFLSEMYERWFGRSFAKKQGDIT